MPQGKFAQVHASSAMPGSTEWAPCSISRPMTRSPKSTRLLTALSIASAMTLVTVALSDAGGVAAASPGSESILVPLVQKFRACDFTPAVNFQSKGYGTARAVISAAKSKQVTAQSNFSPPSPEPTTT